MRSEANDITESSKTPDIAQISRDMEQESYEMLIYKGQIHFGINRMVRSTLTVHILQKVLYWRYRANDKQTSA